MKLIGTHIITQTSSLRVEEGVANDSSSENHVLEHDKVSKLLSNQSSPATSVSKARRISFSQYKGKHLCFKIDSYHAIENLLSALGLTLTSKWSDRLQRYLLGLSYSSATQHLYLDDVPTYLENIKRRFRFHLPLMDFQLQTASLPRSITYNPMAPCQSEIFRLCLDGNIEMVKMWFKSSWASPFVVNQHGENLLHVSNCPCFMAA
jgi:hypothetical protein